MSAVKTAQAWAVHAYTAFGAVFGVLALEAAFEGDYRRTFILLAVALAIDSSDGALARTVGVKHVIPWFDGELLDNIVDYLTYVIVPVAIFMQPGILPDGLRMVSLGVLLASAYGFCRTDAKGLIDHYFQGFPSYWNIMAFYFVVLGTGPWVNLAFLVTAVVFVFMPMRWLYPSRMEKMRAPTIGLGMVWAAMGIVVLVKMPEHSATVAWLSLFYPIYYTAGSAVFHFRST
jgi:phosphatidylcholine synthase